jgi:hypothetical protein
MSIRALSGAGTVAIADTTVIDGLLSVRPIGVAIT